VAPDQRQEEQKIADLGRRKPLEKEFLASVTQVTESEEVRGTLKLKLLEAGGGGKERMRRKKIFCPISKEQQRRRKKG